MQKHANIREPAPCQQAKCQSWHAGIPGIPITSQRALPKNMSQPN